ncbi:MAG: response regulator [Cocleimonas sp.]|nr:response regulator [Cocleimonas sp.]
MVSFHSKAGLGLAINKKLAILMNGNVDVESKYEKGSIFSFSLNAPFVEKEIFEEEYKRLNKENNSQLNNLNTQVLLVEDNRTNQMIAAKPLEKIGCKVTIANNGVESLDALKHYNFDIILMDCQMPIMDGFEASRNIRKSGNNIPIIALTANAQEEDKKFCLQAGMNDFMSKPFEPKTLYQKILNYL